MLNINRKIGLILLLVFGLVSCNNEPKIEPDMAKEDVFLTLDFVSAFNNASIDYNQNEFITSSKDTIIPQKFKFIFSNLRFVKADNTEISFPDRYGYISYDEGNTTMILPEVPEGSYKAIKFYLGLDSAINVSDPSIWPAKHPLNPLYNSMHWGWNTGYIFITHEGQFLNNGVKDNYTFHIATLAFRTEIEIPLTYIHNNGNLDIIQIKADLAKYFDGVHAYSLKTEIPASHSNIAQAPYINKLRANIQQMFSAKQN